MDKIYFNLVRKGAGNNAYGRENGRPVFAAVMSSEASYQLQTEAGFHVKKTNNRTYAIGSSAPKPDILSLLILCVSP